MNGRTKHDGKAICAAAAAASTAAVACAAGCVLPFALPAAALALFGSALAWMAGAYYWMSVIASLAVIVAWLWIVYRSHRSKARPAKTTLLVMVVATAMLGLALLWPSLEPSVIALLLR
jgi:hypothetical protein